MGRVFVVFRKKLFSWVVFGKFQRSKPDCPANFSLQISAFIANKLKFVGHFILAFLAWIVNIFIYATSGQTKTDDVAAARSYYFLLTTVIVIDAGYCFEWWTLLLAITPLVSS